LFRYPPLRGIFAGNNDLVEGIGGKKPTPLQDFITNHLRNSPAERGSFCD
jgi:hypothetical protein